VVFERSPQRRGLTLSAPDDERNARKHKHIIRVPSVPAGRRANRIAEKPPRRDGRLRGEDQIGGLPGQLDARTRRPRLGERGPALRRARQRERAADVEELAIELDRLDQIRVRPHALAWSATTASARYLGRRLPVMLLARRDDDRHQLHSASVTSSACSSRNRNRATAMGRCRRRSGCASPAATDHVLSQRILLSHPDRRAPCRARPRRPEPHYLVFSRRVMTSDGVPRTPSASPRDKITTREQTWSKHGPEMAFSWPPGMGINPGQNGCAARDSNPEPAD
jgi:hypothetical protein